MVSLQEKILLSVQLGAVVGALLGLLMVLRAIRRPRAARGLAVLLVLCAIPYALAVDAFLIEPQRLAVRRITVESAAYGGPPLRIAVMADLHAGSPHGTRERTRRIVARLNRLQPDIILLAGDFVPGHTAAETRSAKERDAIARNLSELRGLHAPLGVYAVLGNHDWWYGGGRVEAVLQQAGITVLENRASPLAGRPIWLAGLADAASTRRQPSFLEASQAVPQDLPVIALAHRPDVFPDITAQAPLTIVRHTHCGQVVFPVVGGLVAVSSAARRWPCGLYRVGGQDLYVSGGVGVSTLPVRFGAVPEIAILTLRPGAPVESKALPPRSENEEANMAKDLKPGSPVRWNTSQGVARGVVVGKVTKPEQVGGHTAQASEDHPQYRVRSDQTGKEAIHHPEALLREDE